MFFQLGIPYDGQIYKNELDRTLLPPLLAENLSVTSNSSRWLAISAKPDNSDLNVFEDECDILIVVGYVKCPRGNLRLFPNEILERLVNGETIFSGQYLLVWHRKQSFRTDIYSTISRSIPCYYASDDKGLWISIRQSSMVSFIVNGTDFDYSSGFPFLRNGYLANESSVFDKISICRSNSITSFGQDQPVSIYQPTDTLDIVGKRVVNESDLQNITNATREAFSPIKSGPIKLGITGGRDSRLIVAAVATSTSSTLETFTKGQPSDPDVIIGKKVAESLGLKHSTIEPATVSNKMAVKINILKRIVSTIINSDFSISAYDNLSAEPKQFDLETLSYGGNGGELLRAPFAYADKNMQSAIKVIRAHSDGRAYVQGDFGSIYGAQLDEWIEQNAKTLSPEALLKKFSLLFRSGRWGSASYSASYARISQRPFYDNGFLKSILPTADHYASSESLYYEVLNRINPNLIGIPFDKGPLKLHTSPLSKYRDIAETLPGKIDFKKTAGIIPSVNWRRVIKGPLGEELLRIIDESCKKNDFGEFVNFQEIQNLIYSVKPGVSDILTSKRVWSTATFAVMLDQIRQPREERISDRVIEISLKP